MSQSQTVSRDSELDTSSSTRSSTWESEESYREAREQDFQLCFSEQYYDKDREQQEHPFVLRHEALSLSLCSAYPTDHPFDFECFPSPPASLADDLVDPLDSIDALSPLVYEELIGDLLLEQWDVDKDAAEFLATVLALRNEVPLRQLNEEDSANFHVDLRDLKIEEPILTHDPILELRQIRRRNEIVITDGGMTPFELKEPNECLEWPQNDLHLPAIKDKVIVSAKLNIDKDMIVFLHEIVEPPGLGNQEIILADYDKVYCLRPVTPPILRVSSPNSPCVLPTAAQELPPTSTPEDLIAREALELEQSIMKADALGIQTEQTEILTQRPHSTTIDPTEAYNSQITTTTHTSSPPWTPKRRLRDLKVDVPLTPQETTASSTKKAKLMSLPPGIEGLIPGPESDPMMDMETSHLEMNHFVNDVVRPFADSAIDKAQNEQLLETDTTMRVKVPQVENISLQPPWEVGVRTSSDDRPLEPDQQRVIDAKFPRELVEDMSAWTGVSKLERRLPWSPFPSLLGSVNLDEQFDDGSAANYMAELFSSNGQDLNTLIMKTNRLRWLDNYEDVDEDLVVTSPNADADGDGRLLADTSSGSPIQAEDVPTRTVLPPSQAKPQSGSLGLVPADTLRPVMPGRMDMSSLLRKRKLELEEASERSQMLNTDLPQLQTTQSTAQKSHAGNRFNALLGDGSVASFMHVQGGTVYNTHLNAQSPRIQSAAPVALMIPHTEAIETIAEAPDEPGIPIPIPRVSFHEPSRQIIISTLMLANRALLRQLRTELPTVDFIEREPQGENDVHARTGPNHDNEADMTLSPSTGLIVTSLQKVKQRPLPGQLSFFGVRERISLTASRYERLLVFVSEGQPSSVDRKLPAQTLDPRDCSSLSDLMGSTALLDTHVQVVYIPGGENELVKWAAATIMRYSIAQPDMKLLQEETLWERFLRNAGMNAFAAQTILAKVKAPDILPTSESFPSSHGSKTVPYGLRAFIQMTAEERVRQFGQVLGGGNLLRRVSAAVDLDLIPASMVQRGS